MKTEQEFLDGIYQKAALGSSEQKAVKMSHPSRWKAGMMAAAMLAVIAVPAGIWQAGKGEQSSGTGQQANKPNTATARMLAPSTNVFDGTITEIRKDGKVLYVTVSKNQEFIGAVKQEEVELVYEPQEDDTEDFRVGEFALFYVIKDNGTFRINNEENGMCHYVYIEDGYRVYETPSGEKISTKDLIEEK